MIYTRSQCTHGIFVSDKKIVPSFQVRLDVTLNYIKIYFVKFYFSRPRSFFLFFFSPFSDFPKNFWYIWRTILLLRHENKSRSRTVSGRRVVFPVCLDALSKGGPSHRSHARMLHSAAFTATASSNNANANARVMPIRWRNGIDNQIRNIDVFGIRTFVRT